MTKKIEKILKNYEEQLILDFEGYIYNLSKPYEVFSSLLQSKDRFIYMIQSMYHFDIITEKENDILVENGYNLYFKYEEKMNDLINEVEGY